MCVYICVNIYKYIMAQAIVAFQKVVRKAKGSSAKSPAKNEKDPLVTQDAPLHVKLVVQHQRERALVKTGIDLSEVSSALTLGKVGIQKFDFLFKAEVAASGFAAHAKWFKKHMSSQTPPLTASASMFKPHVARKITECTKKYVPAAVITGEILTEYPELGKLLFAPQQFHVTDQHHMVSPVPFAAPELRYLVEGSYNILGWPLESVDGETLEEKIAAIQDEDTAKKYVDMAIAGQNDAFFFVHAEPGTAVLLPTHCIVNVCGTWAAAKENSVGAVGLRWGCMPDTDPGLAKLRETLQKTQDSFGKVSDDFAQWVEIISDWNAAKVVALKGALD